jgi:plasmid stabilization system protein ParE
VSALLFVTEAAERQIQEADRWYRENAPGVDFSAQIARAFALLSETPGVGSPFPRARRRRISRLLLRPTRHWLYYTFDARRDVVYVLALWNNRREGDPPGL